MDGKTDLVKKTEAEFKKNWENMMTGVLNTTIQLKDKVKSTTFCETCDNTIANLEDDTKIFWCTCVKTCKRVIK